MSPRILLAFLLFTIIASTTHGSIGGYICPTSRKKLLEIASKALKLESEDLANTYYGAKSYNLLNEPVPKELKSSGCERIKKAYNAEAELESLYYTLSAFSLLQCEGKLHNEGTIKGLSQILQNDKSTTQNIRYAVEILILLGQHVPNAQKVAQLVQAQLKQDDSLLSLGHALHVAALLENAGKFINDRIEDIVVQADEVDGKLLQWEGGLTTTSILITGLLKYPNANPLNQLQADKLGSYLLSRVTVQTPKGISALLEAATSLALSKVSPVAISIAGSAYVSVDKPDLHIKVSNIFGQPLKPTPSPVVAQSATRIADDVVVLAKQPLAAGARESEFMLPLKLEPGYYKILLNAGSHTSTLNARVLGPIEVKNFEVGLSDADGSSAPKLAKLVYPNKLGAALQGDAGQNLQMKFGLSRPVHQAFVRLYSGKKEIIFVAEQDSSKLYKVEIDLGQELTTSDSFNIELIIGDSIITNPFRWNLGAIDVKITAASTKEAPKINRGSKPEIKHMFRPADKRPAQAVSLFFTALTAAPFLVLLILWGGIGANLSNFSARAVPFHVGFGAILALFTLFWLKLDMFTTCAWLIPIGGFTFIAGQRLLSSIARGKKPEKADK